MLVTGELKSQRSHGVPLIVNSPRRPSAGSYYCSLSGRVTTLAKRINRPEPVPIHTNTVAPITIEGIQAITPP